MLMAGDRQYIEQAGSNTSTSGLHLEGAGTLSNLSQVFRSFSHSCQAYAKIIPQINSHPAPNPFPFIIYCHQVIQ
jgi:hypothetical protein